MTFTLSDMQTVITDLHSEFEKASRLLDIEYRGPAMTADARIRLIREYSLAIERVANCTVEVRITGTEGKTP